MKAKLVEVEETYAKIVKQGHRCAKFQQNLKKDSKVCSPKFTDMTDVITEMKMAGKKELEGLAQKIKKVLRKFKRPSNTK